MGARERELKVKLAQAQKKITHLEGRNRHLELELSKRKKAMEGLVSALCNDEVRFAHYTRP